MAVPGGVAPALLASWSCGVEDLCLADGVRSESRRALALGEGWSRRWTATWKVPGAEVVSPVRDLASVSMAGCVPVRRFSWSTRQRHRPGLQYLVSTGRHHGFESVAEQRLLLALDFVGGVSEVLSQPFRLRFASAEGWRVHVPDFLAVTTDGALLVDVRPAPRIGADDRVCFAAAAEVAAACGWGYLVVTGWRQPAWSTVDALSAQRRPLADPLGVTLLLLDAVRCGPVMFADLVAATLLPAVARGFALHLIWHRRLGVDLAQPLTDRARVWPVQGAVRR
jgi:hypothetical protein